MRRPYPSYRNSGVEWLGDLPEHWEVRRLQHICQFAYGDSLPSDTRQPGEVPVFGSNGAVGYHDEPNTLAPVIVIGRKGSHGQVNFHDGSAFAIDTTYFVDERHTSADLRWLFFALPCTELADESLDSAVPGLSREHAYGKYLAVPPRAEQQSIAAFLDHETAKIDTLITKKRLLLERLAEYRTALITRTVTKGLPPEAARAAGLHPNPPLKPSGVAWLGAIPEHWELSQLGRLGSFFKGGGGTKEDEVEGGLPCIRYGDLYTQHEFLIRSSRAGIAEESTDRYRRLRYGDILFAGSGETIEEIGKSAVNLIEGPAYCGGDVIGFRPSIDTDATFFGYATDCATASYQKACMGRGVTVMHIYSSEIKYLLIPLPPPREQQSIAEFLNTKLMDTDTLSSRVEGAVERLQEYRTALITAAVTGKIDVRELEQVQIGASRT